MWHSGRDGEGWTMMRWLKDVLDVAWRCGKTPREWREAIIIPIHKRDVGQSVAITRE